MQVYERTIRRDFETFLTAGFPLEDMAGQFGRKTWRLAEQVQPGKALRRSVKAYAGRIADVQLKLQIKVHWHVEKEYAR